LDYVAGAIRAAGMAADVIDLALADDPDATLRDYFASHDTRLVGLSLRNADDSFWPSCEWFLPGLRELVGTVRGLTDAAVLIGGTGFSIFPEQTLQYTGADFGICGDGEPALPTLLAEIEGDRRFRRVPGLLWREGESICRNPACWPLRPPVPTARDTIDNATYLRLGGQVGLETKRGCERNCIFCADRLAKGDTARLRRPVEVADEAEALLAQGVDILHLCDAEFNIPISHARAVCDELIRRSLGGRLRWYAYMAVVPFDAALAAAMRRAGCAGINFTGPTACAAMLAAYRQPHTPDDLATAIGLCKEDGIAVMADLMLGGPGETPATLAESIDFLKWAGPDCVGASVGVRLYPHLPMTELVAAEGPLNTNTAIRRRYEGDVDLFRPTFYVSPALGERPAQLVRDLIAGDSRFFEPADETRGSYNYNDNEPLVRAIASGARGAYWDILRKLREG